MSDTTTILALVGSLRRDSYNRALARAAAELAPRGVSVVIHDTLASVPFYDGDVEAAGNPATVEQLRAAVAGADALLVVTPEYNGSTSGVLKNTLDWASRGPDRILVGKPAAVMGASPGAGGAAGGIDSVVRTLRRVRSQVLDRTVSVPHASQAFGAELELVAPGVRDEIAALLAELAEEARGAESLAA
jgi:chromate reductase